MILLVYCSLTSTFYKIIYYRYLFRLSDLIKDIFYQISKHLQSVDYKGLRLNKNKNKRIIVKSTGVLVVVYLPASGELCLWGSLYWS